MIPVWWAALLFALIGGTCAIQVVLHGRREYRRGWMDGSHQTHQAALQAITEWGEAERAKIRDDG